MWAICALRHGPRGEGTRPLGEFSGDNPGRGLINLSYESSDDVQGLLNLAAIDIEMSHHPYTPTIDRSGENLVGA